jgi:hypothetical protein
MKTLFRKILCVMDAFSRARAANYLSRTGQHEAAKRLMLETKTKC